MAAIIHEPPPYFTTIRDKARRRWDQLEADPGLAGPWHQLFSQLRSDPRHVLSELLQNADDAHATWVRVAIDDDVFRFEYDGDDFDACDLESLCGFGLSNKRFLHTIGFRGVGFKTTFSLGPEVTVSTPSLNFRFKQSRFTEPIWQPGPANSHTVISIRVDSHDKVRILEEHLAAWQKSTVPLLFFNHIAELHLQGTQVTKDLGAAGPVPGSRWLTLKGQQDSHVVLLTSPAEDFPPEAVDEVRQERGDIEFELPPCAVQLVLGLPGLDRLYVVLPTNVTLALPFSINAPFLQDPARVRIKSPSTSPTNRWLLQRVGRLAAFALGDWLDKRSLSLQERADAYAHLLPPPLSSLEGNDIGHECARCVIESFEQAMAKDNRVLLTTDGELATPGDCLGLPAELLDVWSPQENLALFGKKKTAVLACEVSEDSRERIAQWKWLDMVGAHAIASRLAREPYPPRPATNHHLLVLWAFLAKYRSDESWYFWDTRNLAIVPVRGVNQLQPASRVIVIGAGEKDLSRQDRQLLSQYVHLADTDWLAYVGEDISQENSPDEHDQRMAEQRAAAAEMLGRLNLNQRTGLAPTIEQAARAIFDRDDPGDDGIQLAYIAARADVVVPDKFRFLCDDKCWYPVTDQLLVDVEAVLEYLPDDWAASHLVSARYDNATDVRDLSAWQRWAGSTKSRLRRFVMPMSHDSRMYYRDSVKSLAIKRGGHPPESYPYKGNDFTLTDYDFPEALWEQWQRAAIADPSIWPLVVLGICRAWQTDWLRCCEATIFHRGYTYRQPLDCGTLAAAWLHRLRSLPCLPDRYGRPCLPAELYRTTAATGHLLDIEPFLHPDYDHPEYLPFLDLLGVRSQPGSYEHIVERIRALAQADSTPIGPLHDLYRALDRTLPYLPHDSGERQTICATFAAERLIHARDGSWHTSATIFRRNHEQLPDVSIVPDDLVDLSLWERLNVAPQPTVDLMLNWLRSLSHDQRLSDSDARRVRNLLSRAPQRVWEEVKHWLSAIRTWEPVETLRYGADDVAVAANLFPAVRQATADLSMLSPELCGQAPFSHLPLLAQVLEQRQTTCQPAGAASQPRWLVALADCLLRARSKAQSASNGNGDDADPPWLPIAARLRKTQLQPVMSIQVIPYLNGEPAGQPNTRHGLWQDDRLYVVGTGPRVYRALVDEISSAFDDHTIKRAIAACAQREPDWINEYFEAEFDLAPPESIAVTRSHDAAELSSGPEAPAAGPPTGEPEKPETEPGNEDEPDEEEDGVDVVIQRRKRARQARRDEAFAAFARRAGFERADGTDTFVDHSGARIQRASGMWHYERIDADGQIYYYWVCDKSLDQGVTLRAETWHLLHAQPKQVSLLIPQPDGTLREYTGVEIQQLVSDRTIELFPAAYRLCRAT